MKTCFERLRFESARLSCTVNFSLIQHPICSIFGAARLPAAHRIINQLKSIYRSNAGGNEFVSHKLLSSVSNALAENWSENGFKFNFFVQNFDLKCQAMGLLAELIKFKLFVYKSTE